MKPSLHTVAQSVEIIDALKTFAVTLSGIMTELSIATVAAAELQGTVP